MENERVMKFDEFSLYKDFEDIVIKIFKENNFKVEISAKDKYDFRAILENTFCYVEVKHYSNKLPKLDLLKTACNRLLSQKDNEFAKLILVVSSYVTPSLQQDIFKEFGVIIWDIKTLFSLSFDYADTYYELQNILVKSFKSSVDEFSIIDNDFKKQIVPNLVQSSTNAKSKPLSHKGKRLCHDLNALSSGNTDATLYENKCIEILKYLFDNNTDLTLWRRQLSSDDGLNRFDLLCRIISYNNTFWTELATDFHTRYVVFEFKNYTDPIKQGQIFTTEKYLFLTALRSVSFIIARVGADINAIKASKGALKEAGKLIVILQNSDICDMLALKDNGDEPSIVLRNKIDEMLITLNR